MDYETMRQHSESSDHGPRIISELEQPLKDALASTPSMASVLEVGNRDGGSAAIQLYYIALENKGRKFFTADVQSAPKRIIELAEQLNIPWKHYQGSQADFVKQNAETYGFIFLDADHNQTTVPSDMRMLAPNLIMGGIMAVDDMHEWTKIPDFEDVGLRRVYYQVDMGNKENHICYWRKSS